MVNGDIRKLMKRHRNSIDAATTKAQSNSKVTFVCHLKT